MTAAGTPIKGQSLTTGTVHYARTDNYGGLVQRCGIKANQHAYLDRVAADTPVTCRRSGCTAAAAEAAQPATRPTPQEWNIGRCSFNITELRELASDKQIPGRSKMTGAELAAALAPHFPQLAN